MRTLFVLILLMVAGWFGYQEWWIKAPPPWEPLTMPDPIAWKSVTQFSTGQQVVAVCLFEGNRWRTEERVVNDPRIVVSICDGIHMVGNVAALTRKSDMGAGIEKEYGDWRDETPLRTDTVDGHSCWVYARNPNNIRLSGEVWISKETRFPIFYTGLLKSGVRLDTHVRVLKSDFSILDKTAFNVNNIIPMLAPFLNANYN